MADEQQPTSPPQQTFGTSAPESASTQAIIALVLGIVGLFCNPFGIAAWIIGQKERNAIKRGESPEAGMGLATAGWILGIIDTVLLILSILAGMIILVLVPIILSGAR